MNVGEEDFAWHSPKLLYELETVVGEQVALGPVKMADLLTWAAMAGVNWGDRERGIHQ